ncbi:MAG: hypothetical protein GF418_15780 [Chitinivibrionales bacterium]|nr:hypothetical protein [Chitinivibrionales bacterium]MBD3397082.1 hypothetical protein [Chitinivibrionales bacterium]
MTPVVRNFKIQCPSCHGTCELYLSTNAPIVILNCPNCWTPMLHNHNGVFILSQRQIDDLSRSKEFSILNLLERVASREPADARRAAALHDEFRDHAAAMIGTSTPPVFDARDRITEDDVLDLRIELETCRDSLEFISRL